MPVTSCAAATKPYGNGYFIALFQRGCHCLWHKLRRDSCIQPIRNMRSCIWRASMPSVKRSLLHVLLVCPPLHKHCPICFHPGLLKFWISLLWNVITFWNQGPGFSLCFELSSHWSLRQVSKDHWSSGSSELLQVFLGRVFLPVCYSACISRIMKILLWARSGPMSFLTGFENLI